MKTRKKKRPGAPPGKGAPPDRGASPSPASLPALSTGRAVALGALALVAIAGFASMREGAPAEAPASRPAARASGARAGAAAPEVAAKQAKIEAIWAAYEKLPAEQKNKAKLTDTLDAAAQVVKAEPRTTDDRKLLEQQGIEFRKRAAPMVRPETRATGEKFDVLVPSPEAARCVELGALWSRDAANMAMMGFKRIECAGSPPRVWELGS